MTARETRTDRARERATAIAEHFARGVRQGRLNVGKRQQDAAKEAGIDRAEWSRIERGRRTGVPLELASRMASAVGLDLVVKLYPSDVVVRDRAHLRLPKDVRTLLGPGWTWSYEVPLGSAPDQRAWDAVAVHDHTGLSLRVEAETSMRDVQELQRRLEAKRVADGEPRLVLAVRDTRANRDAVRTADAVLRAAFPAEARPALARLRAGEDPGGDVLLLVDWVRPDPGGDPAGPVPP